MHPALIRLMGGKVLLSVESMELIGNSFHPRMAKRNELILQQGEVARHIYVVVKGALRIFLTDPDGNEATRFLVLEGQIGTAFPSFILQEPSVAAIQSIGSSELLACSFQDRQQLFRTVPGWETWNRLSLEQDYIASIRRIESLITMDSRERYQALLRDRPEVIRDLPARIVADYLGITQETLSRLKAKR